MKILVQLSLSAEAQQGEALLKFLDEILVGTRSYDGCLGVEVLTDVTSDQVLLLEWWDQKESFDRYMTWRVERGDFQTLQSFLIKPPGMKFLTPQNDLLAAVRQASARWVRAFNSGDAEGCTQQYSEDAVMQVKPFGTYTGHTEIKAFWTNLVAQGFKDVEYMDPRYEVLDDKTVKLSSHWKMNKAQGFISEELWRLHDDGRAYLIHDAFEVDGE